MPRVSEKAKAKNREYTRKWRKENPDRIKAHKKTAYKKKRSIFEKYKLGPCKDCKKTYPVYVMDFHHKNPKEKLGPINWGWSNKRILKEIKKCDLLCSNCHRIRTWSQT